MSTKSTLKQFLNLSTGLFLILCILLVACGDTNPTNTVASATTAAATTVPATTVPPTTVAPTTAPATTVVPTNTAPTTTSVATTSATTAATAAPATTAAVTAGSPAGGPTLAKDEQEISFTSGKDTIYGTLLIPEGKTGKLPAAVLISGSGPTDRNGNNTLLQGQINSHLNFARILADQGVISIRYDKIGTGKTGLGSFKSNIKEVGFDTFVDQTKAAYEFLKVRPEVDPQRIMLLGHSEGGLIALVAADQLKATNGVKALILAAPLSKPYLETIRTQLTNLIDQQTGGNKEVAAPYLTELDQIIKSLYEKEKLPDTVSQGFVALFSPANEKFLAQVAKYDPAKIAAGLPNTLPVLMLCGQKDQQVPCSDVQSLAQGFQKAGNSKANLFELANVNHVFKEVPGTPNPETDYTNPNLKFSQEATDKITTFVKANL